MIFRRTASSLGEFPYRRLRRQNATGHRVVQRLVPGMGHVIRHLLITEIDAGEGGDQREVLGVGWCLVEAGRTYSCSGVFMV